MRISDVLEMPELEYNHWLGYLMSESEEHEQSMNRSKRR